MSRHQSVTLDRTESSFNNPSDRKHNHAPSHPLKDCSLTVAEDIITLLVNNVMHIIKDKWITMKVPGYAMRHIAQQSSIQVQQTHFASDKHNKLIGKPSEAARIHDKGIDRPQYKQFESLTQTIPHKRRQSSHSIDLGQSFHI
jgi:hypothetical protein